MVRKGKEMGWRGGNENGEGEGREIPVSEIGEVVSAPYTNSVCVGMEVSHVKCTSLQFVVNINHMKVASDSIGPCVSHVT